MTQPDRDNRESLRSGSYWRSILRAMVAVTTVRMAVRIGLAVTVALVLLFMGWQGR